MSASIRAALALLLLPLAACAHREAMELSSVRPCPAPAGCVTFRAYAPPPAEQPSGTPVFLVSASGLSSLGTTGEDGVIVLPKTQLRAPGLSALLFCWDGRSLACTAVRLDSGAVATYDWLNVSLPANPLVHRSQALPSPKATPIPDP